LKIIISCPSCGAQLEIPNQIVFQKCGSELPAFSKSSVLAKRYSVSTENHKMHQLLQKLVIIPGLRLLSKRCFGFGILSRVNSGKAKELEPESSILKARSALGVIGLVINSILVVTAIILI